MQQSQRYCRIYFIFYSRHSSLSKHGAYITHNATRLLSIWSEIRVCCASSSYPGPCSLQQRGGVVKSLLSDSTAPHFLTFRTHNAYQTSHCSLRRHKRLCTTFFTNGSVLPDNFSDKRSIKLQHDVELLAATLSKMCVIWPHSSSEDRVGRFQLASWFSSGALLCCQFQEKGGLQ